MKRITKWSRIVLGIALAMAFVPGAALAATTGVQATSLADEASADAQHAEDDAALDALVKSASALIMQESDQGSQTAATNKVLAYDRALIDQIGTQEKTGHTICCPSFSCAYADAVMDGTVHSHEYYSCSNCLWTDWGGADSSYRNVGGDEQVLREAYDQISAGKPTVVHVSASYGEHWVALIGYENATEPDHLSLSNFIALDPWDGAQINAGASFSLYGDGCQHISDRAPAVQASQGAPAPSA